MPPTKPPNAPFVPPLQLNQFIGADGRTSTVDLAKLNQWTSDASAAIQSASARSTSSVISGISHLMLKSIGGFLGLSQLPVGTANQLYKTNAGATSIEHATLSVGTTGADFAVAFGAGTITLNLPDAGAAARGAITTGAQTIAGAKTLSSTPTFSTMTAGSVLFAGTAGLLSQNNANFFWDNTGTGKLRLGTSLTGYAHTLPVFSLLGGDSEFADGGSLTSESLNETNFATHAKWDVTGDFNDTGGNATYTHATGSGTLVQTTANMVTPGYGFNTLYRFTYETSGYSGDVAGTITTAFAYEAVSLPLSNGSHTVFFRTRNFPNPSGSFTISCTSTSGGVVIDNVSLMRVLGGDVKVAGRVLAGRLFSTPVLVVYNPVAGTTIPADSFLGVGTNLDVWSNAFNRLTVAALTGVFDTAPVTVLSLESRPAAPGNGHGVALSFRGYNNAGTPARIVIGRIDSVITDVTASSEDGQLDFNVVAGGTLTKELSISSSEAAFTNKVSADSFEPGLGAQTGNFMIDFLMFATTVSGSGAVTRSQTRNLFLNTGTTAGSVALTRGTNQQGLSQGKNAAVINWSKRIRLNLNFYFGVGSANGIGRILLGKNSATAGDLTDKGIGVKWLNNALWGTTHNGAALDDVDLAVTLTSNVTTIVSIVSDGAGNITWYVNGVSKGTSAGGPTGDSTTNVTRFHAELINGADASQNTANLMDAPFYIEQ